MLEGAIVSLFEGPHTMQAFMRPDLIGVDNFVNADRQHEPALSGSNIWSAWYGWKRCNFISSELQIGIVHCCILSLWNSANWSAAQ